MALSLTWGDDWGKCRRRGSEENMQMWEDGVYDPELPCSETEQ